MGWNCQLESMLLSKEQLDLEDGVVTHGSEIDHNVCSEFTNVSPSLRYAHMHAEGSVMCTHSQVLNVCC